MEITFEVARNSHLDTLVTFAQEFNQEDHHPFAEAIVRAGLTHLLSNEAVGRVWLIRAGAETVGYLVLTLGYRLAYGRYAFIDEIYVRPDYRSQGIGRRAIIFAEEMCRELAIKALHLEVEQANTKARALYMAVGFVDYSHYLMTCWLNRPLTADCRPPQDIFVIDDTSQARDYPLGITFAPAQNSDIETLLKLRQEAGAEGQVDSRAAIAQLVSDGLLGRVWLIQTDNQPAGYVGVTFSYSLEFHGRDALLDELYLRRGLHRPDVAVESLKFAQAQCQALGVNALHAEMERANALAQVLYRTVGFEDDDSYLMTKWLT